jgi:hypothetical protein
MPEMRECDPGLTSSCCFHVQDKLTTMAARMFAFQTADEDEYRRSDPIEERARQERLRKKHGIRPEKPSEFNSSFLGEDCMRPYAFVDKE